MFRILIVAMFMAIGGFAQASNYPPEYSHQTVRLSHQGAVLFAHVGSGIMSREVIGYKNSGSLTVSRPDFIDAIVMVRCPAEDNSVLTRKSTIQLKPEWNGTGYMSEPLQIEMYFPSQGCAYGWSWKIQVAFSDGLGNWDSRSGTNYRYESSDIWKGKDTLVYETHQAGAGNSLSINELAWKFIVGEMKK